MRGYAETTWAVNRWPTSYNDQDTTGLQCKKMQPASPSAVTDARGTPIDRPTDPNQCPLAFHAMGVDILGPFPQASGQRKFLLVAINYSKWVEAKPLAMITEAKVKDFVWQSIICRFGLPRVLITNNGCQFSSSKFVNFSQSLHVSHHFTSIGHPQANREAKVTYHTLLQELKVRSDQAKRSWVDELHSMLWAYRTTQRVSTGETPFNHFFETEAIIPIEIGLPSLWVENYNDQDNARILRANLDLLEEV